MKNINHTRSSISDDIRNILCSSANMRRAIPLILRLLMNYVNLSTNLASHFFDLVIGKILTSRLSLSKHLAHNLGNLLLLGKIGVFHNRRNAKFNLTIPLQQLNGLETLVIIMVANKYAFLQITRRRFLNEWEAFKKVISRRNIRRRITIPLTLSNLKLLRRITRTENILHRNFTRRQVAIQNRVASNIGISQSTFSVKVLNLFSRSRRKTNKQISKHSTMLRNKETRHRMFIGLLNTTRKLA